MKNDHLMVTIHYDPIVTSDAAVGVLRTRLTEKLRQLNPALSLHDLRIVPGKTHTNVLFDLVLPAGYAGDKVELLTQMEQFIKEQDPTYNCIIKVEQSYTARSATRMCSITRWATPACPARRNLPPSCRTCWPTRNR